jgi:NAD(P)-dependent dehydrogenase (short-subunit alcohol dehydrogenase family)
MLTPAPSIIRISVRVSIASLQSFTVGGGHAQDSVSARVTRAATMNYVKSLAKQRGPKGIRVNGVASVSQYTNFGNTPGLDGPAWNTRVPLFNWGF